MPALSKIISLAAIILLMILVLPFPPANIAEATLLSSDVWVAPPPLGSDGNPGTEALPFATIDKGIKSVSDNGTVHVAAGTYHEYGLQLHSTMNLVGAGAFTTIIDGGPGANGHVIEVSSEPTQENTISGFTIQNGSPGGSDAGGGIYISASHIVTINDCVIINNTKGDGSGPFPTAGGGVCNDGGALYMNRCTVSGNTASDTGGGIFSRKLAEGDSGLVELVDCTINNNEAEQGSGIYNDSGELYMYGCTVSGNTASDTGGGIFNLTTGGGDLGIAELIDCTVSGNTATSGTGGGVFNQGGLLTYGCTVSGNSAFEAGGGIFNVLGVGMSGFMLLIESTISSNRILSSAPGAYGAGIANEGLIMEVVNCTVANNIAPGSGSFGGGFYDNEVLYSLFATTIVANNRAGTGNNGYYNPDNKPTSLGYNLDSENSCGFDQPTDLVNTDPLLGPLQDNGGPTFTHALFHGSPAIDSSECVTGIVLSQVNEEKQELLKAAQSSILMDTANQLDFAFDQRGVPRPQGAACDIGAYELAQASVDTATGTGTTSFSTLNGYITELTSLAVSELDCIFRDDLNFPHGLFSFNVVDITPGSVATVVLILPSDMPAGTQYWKCLNGQWVDCTSLLGSNDGDSVLTVTITDGGLGDRDGEANGEISDPGGPEFVVTPAERVSTTSPTIRRPLTQAQMSLQYVSITPQKTGAGQPVTITANVVNTGGEAGNFNVPLKINGKIEQSSMVTVGPQGAQSVQFTVTKAQPGTYNVDILGKSGSFIILGAGSSTSSSSGGLIALLIIGVLVLATVVVLIFSRRRA